VDGDFIFIPLRLPFSLIFNFIFFLPSRFSKRFPPLSPTLLEGKYGREKEGEIESKKDEIEIKKNA
jgi:hypothetical protein